MNIDHVIISPLVSEKTTILKDQRVFCFQVHPHSNKIEISFAVKKHFGVTPVKCRTIVNKPKIKRLRGVAGKTKRIKKAYIYLKPNDTISIFEGAR